MRTSGVVRSPPLAAVTTVQNKAAPVNTIFQAEESINFSSLLSQDQAKPAKSIGQKLWQKVTAL